MVNQLLNYYQRLPKEFWAYNYLASFVYFLLTGQDHFLYLLLYPLVVGLIHFANQYFKQVWVYQFVGYQALEKEFVSLILTFFLNQIIWKSPITLIIILVIYIAYRNQQSA